ncbi:DUF1707 SHOCT-like domain-containing protein [Nocardiopsis xinjiangensis]|uniref:DUF1707 SHOCT-like domain-containing protein n=1 Tax=Nocardiopsis xinjiangensis TaxID=124285 RepID=UPI00034707E6|nr:DUF1707 domain-containing protein [Nocardiopsis xinjiangensis]
MRVSDADRDQVAEALREAAAEGRITLDELDDRLERTYSSQVYADLEPVVADLPSAHGSDLAQNPAAGAASVSEQSGDALVINAKGETTVRKGTWEVPARVEAHARWGACKLDLREARLTSPVTEIWIDVTGGSGSIILPEGATAHIDVDSSWFGSLKSQVDTIRKQGVPHFVVTGEAKGGSLTVRYKRSSGFLGIFGG